MSPKSRADGIISFDGQSHADFHVGDCIEISRSAIPITCK